MPVNVLVISGAAGVGKTSVAWEMSTQMERLGVPHSVIETDEAERLFVPGMTDAQVAVLCWSNVEWLWQSYEGAGSEFLILVGVFDRPSEHMEALLKRRNPASLYAVRLTAGLTTLDSRLLKREIGSGGEDQRERTLAQLQAITHHDSPVHLVVDTNNRDVVDIALEILRSWMGFSDGAS